MAFVSSLQKGLRHFEEIKICYRTILLGVFFYFQLDEGTYFTEK